MEYGHDIRCPKCGSQHGPAAKSCECGHVFRVHQEDPAPPKYFFLIALFFGSVTVASVFVSRNNAFTYLPIGGLLFTSVAATLGIRSWLFFLHRKQTDKKETEQ